METLGSLSQRGRQLMDQHQFLDYEDAYFTGCYYANML